MFKKNILDFCLLNLYSPDSIGDVGGVGDDADILSGGDAEDDTGDDTPPEEGDEEDTGDDNEDGEDSGEEREDKEEEGEEEPTDDEDEGEEDDEEGKEDEDLEEKLPSYKTINEKFPKLFKEHPELRAAIFKAEKYTELFGSVKAAENAIGKVAIFDKLGDDIVGNGNITNLLDTVQKNNKESFDKIAFTVLPYLFEKDKDLYYEVVAAPIKGLLRAAISTAGEGKTKEEANLKNAALHLHKFFFKNYDVDSEIKADKFTGKDGEVKETAKEKELRERLERMENGQNTSFQKGIDDSYIKNMTKHILSGLASDERLSDYAKEKIAEDILKSINKTNREDKGFGKKMMSLFSQAKENGYDNSFKVRILNVALTRAKEMVPSLRKQMVAKALGKKVRAEEEEEGKDKKQAVRKVIPPSGKKPEAKPGITAKKSSSSSPDLDILQGRN